MTQKKEAHLIEEFIKTYTFHMTDFVYDKKSGVLFAGICTHVILMRELYNIINPDSSDILPSDAADNYILEGHGIFKSKAGGCVWYSLEFKPELFKPMFWCFEEL